MRGRDELGPYLVSVGNMKPIVSRSAALAKVESPGEAQGGDVVQC